MPPPPSPLSNVSTTNMRRDYTETTQSMTPLLRRNRAMRITFRHQSNSGTNNPRRERWSVRRQSRIFESTARKSADHVENNEIDSLQSLCYVSILQHLHNIASQVEEVSGDHCPERSRSLYGIQGNVSSPDVLNHDYSYFVADVNRVRQYLNSHLKFLTPMLDDLMKIALKIYDRYENRRRMGVEIVVLNALAHSQMKTFQLPTKYFSKSSVMEMMVSIQHRSERPDRRYIWSIKSTKMFVDMFRNCSSNLVTLKLCCVNDEILKAISIHCDKSLKHLDITLGLDVTDEGLMALAGKSKRYSDQGKSGSNQQSKSIVRADHESVLNNETEFKYVNKNHSDEFFIKDCFLFTPSLKRLQSREEMKEAGRVDTRDIGIGEKASLKKNRKKRNKIQFWGGTKRAHVVKTSLCDNSSPTCSLFNTNYGCLNLESVTIRGEYLYSPLASRYFKGFHNAHSDDENSNEGQNGEDGGSRVLTKLGQKIQTHNGKHLDRPILDMGFHSMLLNLKKVKEFNMDGLSVMISHLSQALVTHSPDPLLLSSLKTLVLDRNMRLTYAELKILVDCCPNVERVVNFCSDCATDFQCFHYSSLSSQEMHFMHYSPRIEQSTPDTFSPVMCYALRNFISQLNDIQHFHCKLRLECFANALLEYKSSVDYESNLSTPLTTVTRKGRILKLNDLRLKMVHLNVNTTVTSLCHILIMREMLPKLECFEGSLSLNIMDRESTLLTHIDYIRQQHCIKDHHHLNLIHKTIEETEEFEENDREKEEDKMLPFINSSHMMSRSSTLLFSTFIQTLVIKENPWSHLKVVNIEGTITILMMQVIVGGAVNLQELTLSISPLNLRNVYNTSVDISGWRGVAIDDLWIEAFLHVSPNLPKLRVFSLSVNNKSNELLSVDKVGSFSEQIIHKFLTVICECQKSSVKSSPPPFTHFSGEFNKISRQKMKEICSHYSKTLPKLEICRVYQRPFDNVGNDPDAPLIVTRNNTNGRESFDLSMLGDTLTHVVNDETTANPLPACSSSNRSKRFQGYVFKP